MREIKCLDIFLSFPDTEVGENDIENLFRADLPCQLAQLPDGKSEVLTDNGIVGILGPGIWMMTLLLHLLGRFAFGEEVFQMLQSLFDVNSVSRPRYNEKIMPLI